MSSKACKRISELPQVIFSVCMIGVYVVTISLFGRSRTARVFVVLKLSEKNRSNPRWVASPLPAFGKISGRITVQLLVSEGLDNAPMLVKLIANTSLESRFRRRI